jgi:pyruvate dehydrogenase E2 component (dihydrolipoamide acetyltransferase)
LSDTVEIRVPDIGDFKDVPVVEVLIKPGDTIAKETPLVVLESDKASMEVPSSAAGTIADVRVKPGDKVSQGTLIATLSGAPSAAGDGGDAVGGVGAVGGVMVSGANEVSAVEPPAPRTSIELQVPDIGGFHDVPVVEVLIKPGDNIEKEQPIVVLESDKASMEVPAPAAGTVTEVRIKPGDKVSQGSAIASITSSGPSTTALRASAQDDTAHVPAKRDTANVSAERDNANVSGVRDTATVVPSNGAVVHASPAIRRFARELGVDLHGLHGSGPNGRVTREDVQGFVKRALADGGGARTATATSAAFAGLPAWPKVDFAQFGPVERKPLSRIKKLSGPNLHRNWLQIPHITNYDEADITELEAFRNAVNAEHSKSGGAKLTMLAFLVKASVAALTRFPEFNASLEGDELVYKQYYNIGFAADTPNGLVVPVIKNAEGKGLLAIAAESAALAVKARDGKLGLGDMQGGTFTISSIGGIGGTAFTQIVNAPEVAILGAVRATTKPVWDGKAFQPRLVLPISVSYDHRVIDGAGAARFLTYVAALLADFRRTAL